MVLSHLMVMTTKNNFQELIDHLFDLKENSERYYRHQESAFLNEEEQAEAMKYFAPSDLIRYDGGYKNASKKKVIFSMDREDDFSDIVCIRAWINQKFVKINHRDILGALMSLQIDRHSFGDFFIKDDAIYIYTSAHMARFLIDQLTSISKLRVQFEEIDEHPEQIREYREYTVIISSLRLDAFVAALAHKSRKESVELIRAGLVQVNHVTLVDPAVLCNNNCTISIRGSGRFEFDQIVSTTKKDRLVAQIRQAI